MNELQAELKNIGSKIKEMEAKERILELRVGVAVSNGEDSKELYNQLKNVRNGIKYAKEVFKTKSKKYENA